MSESILSEEVVQPDPARVIEGLRDTGYTFETAVADVVDNSIAAEASEIHLNLGLSVDGEPYFFVLDNGTGMDPDALKSAMRYGSPPRPNPHSLGKFGMGLKTASTSFCRQLTLVSRGQARGSLSAVRWDLDHVASSGQWLLQTVTPPTQAVTLVEDLVGDGTGTVVAWNKIDRLIKDYKDRTGTPAKNAIKKIEADLMDHLGLTYARFLDPGYAGVQNLAIFINSDRVIPWDPFCVDIGAETLYEREVPVEIGDSADPEFAESASFALTAYALPPRSDLSLADEKRARISAGGAGFYVYRENRCISAGGWLGMHSVEPHYSLCRIDFSFDHRLDDAFQIDIKKSRIQMLPELFDFVRGEINPTRQEANRRYRSNRTKKAVDAGEDKHDASNRTIAKRSSDLVGSTLTNPIGQDRAEVTNQTGTSIIRIATPETTPSNVHIEAVESTRDGILFEPRVFGPNVRGVALNAGHPFYTNCYQSGDVDIMLQGMDFLLWSIAEAELGVISTEDQAMLENLRLKISRLTRALAEDLPEPQE